MNIQKGIKIAKKKPRGKLFKKGFDERRNLNGAPRKGESQAETYNKLMNLPADELADYFGRNNELGQAYAKMPTGIPVKILLAGRNLAAEMFEPNSRRMQLIMERTEGKVPDTPPLQSGKETPLLTIPPELLAPDFLAPYRDIINNRHTEYVFYGGRGSTKSSFVSLAIIYLLVNNPTMHALATRQVAITMRDSVYSQLVWAINELGLMDNFKCITSPLEIEYLPTKQKIYFRGADDVGKIKSIKPSFGYIGLLWFEELDQFHGQESIRKIEQSVIRGGDKAYIFKSFNPPPTANNWANKYIQIPKESQYKHKSSYLTVPAEWLGLAFIEEAEHLKNVNPTAYEHEYLGMPNNDGGAVFTNVEVRAITDEEIKQFDRVYHGLDWGYYPDPLHYSRVHYDSARRVLYIFGELRKWKTRNQDLLPLLKEYGVTPEDFIIADSAEPDSVADFKAWGLNIRGAEKGDKSVRYGIKWLQSMNRIIIDPVRAPYSVTEFTDYEFERTKDGEIISEFPDKNNHAIDSVRYATNLIWRKRGE